MITDLAVAARAPNLVARAMLFVIGYEWARYTNRNRFRTGIAMGVIGSVIVSITVALGG